MPDTEKRFWSKVRKTSRCWTWKAGRTAFGYGVFIVDGSRNRPARDGAHRFSWRLHFGEIPEGQCVLHRCDNPACVKPDHLFLGTKKDNALDRESKGRGFNRNKTHCVNGHRLTAANSYVYTLRSGKQRRYCRECGRRHTREYMRSTRHSGTQSS